MKLDKVALGPAPRPHPLAAQVGLHSVPGEHTALFWHKGRRYVAEKDRPITDEAGQPVAELAGWHLTLTGERFAVLSNAKERATVVMRPDGGANE